MGAELPEVSREEFSRCLSGGAGAGLLPGQVELLYLHYSELRRWNPRVTLVGPVGKGQVVDRHYGESLAALRFIGEGRVLVDVGSGAGFPGFVLAVARPSLSVTLVEARERKWSFLKNVCRLAGLSTTCLNARVGAASVEGLPREIDWITARAVSTEDLGLSALLPRLSTSGGLILWCGERDPVVPPIFELRGEEPLIGSRQRRILLFVRSPEE